MVFTEEVFIVLAVQRIRRMRNDEVFGGEIIYVRLFEGSFLEVKQEGVTRGLRMGLQILDMK